MHANIFHCHKGIRGQTGSPQPRGDRLLVWEGTRCISQQRGRKQISQLVLLEFCRVNAWLFWMVSEETVGAVPMHLSQGEGEEVLQAAHPHQG